MNALPHRFLLSATTLILGSLATACPDGSTSPDGQEDQLFRLTIATGGNGQGSVAADPSSSNPHPSGTYLQGASVSLQANPAGGSAFAGWTGDCAGTANPCSLVMTADRAVTATFEPTHTLTINRTGSGTGTFTATPPGPAYLRGSSVMIAATSAEGSTFAGWRGACASADNPCTLTMDGNKEVTGAFTAREGVGRFDGDYEGTWSGGQSDGSNLNGPLAMTLSNGGIQGTLAPISGSAGTFTGSASASGDVTARIAASSPSACSVELRGQLTTSFANGVTRASAAGTYTLQVAPNACNAGTGSWTLTRR